MLSGESDSFVRQDVAAEHWSGPPEECFGWWKTTAKHIADTTTPRQISSETLLSLFERLLLQPEEADTLYILALLLLRRKLLRYERETVDTHGNKLLEVYSLHTNMAYQLPAVMPSHERLETIKQQLEPILNGTGPSQ